MSTLVPSEWVKALASYASQSRNNYTPKGSKICVSFVTQELGHWKTNLTMRECVHICRNTDPCRKTSWTHCSSVSDSDGTIVKERHVLISMLITFTSLQINFLWLYTLSWETFLCQKSHSNCPVSKSSLHTWNQQLTDSSLIQVCV